MSIAEELRSTVQEANDLDQKLAKRIGQHIDHQSQALAALRETTDAKLFAPQAFRSLPPAIEEQFQSLRVCPFWGLRADMKGMKQHDTLYRLMRK